MELRQERKTEIMRTRERTKPSFPGSDKDSPQLRGNDSRTINICCKGCLHKSYYSFAIEIFYVKIALDIKELR